MTSSSEVLSSVTRDQRFTTQVTPHVIGCDLEHSSNEIKRINGIHQFVIGRNVSAN